MNKNEFGAFCKVYGKTLRNRVLEFILEMGELDWAVSDIMEEVNISKPKLYQIIKELEEGNIITVTREVSGTELYVLNLREKKAQILMESFKKCLNEVIDKHIEEQVVEAEVFVNGVSILDLLKGGIPT